MTFEKHFRSVSRVVSQRLGILRKSWLVFHDRLLPERCFRGFVLPVLEYGFAVWCSAADTHLKLLGRVVNSASFLTVGVFECGIAHRRSVYMLYTITRCTLALYSVLRTCRAVCASAGYTRCFDCSFMRHLAVTHDFYSCFSISVTGVLLEMGCYWRISRAGQILLIGQMFVRFLSPSDFPFIFFHSIGLYCGAGDFGLIGC